jgi:hypothetical membrane protein
MKRFHLSFISGLAACVGYMSFSLLAFMRYPMNYSPLSNWLSDLGNPLFNPGGSNLYNLGVIFTAIFLIIFFLSLYSWKITGNRVQVIMLRLTQACGISASLCLMMSAIYPINHFRIHATLSTVMYVLLSTAFVFSAAMLRYHLQVPRWLLFLGVSSAIIVIMTSVFADVYVLEWITVLCYLGYTLLLSVETEKLENHKIQSDSG